MSRRTDASSPSGGLRVATGTYTGNGAATQAVVGVGFQPIAILIYPQLDSAATASLGFKNTQDGAFTCFWNLGVAGYYYILDMIISLNANGFTVGDGTGDSNRFNVNARVYTYICWG